MILKSLSRKSSSYGQLLRYITNDKAVVKDDKGSPILITHNLQCNNLKSYEQAFEINDLNRAYHRKGENKLYHEILSWHELDSKNIDVNKLMDMAKEYIRLRNESALYYGAIHRDKKHIHIHLCVSATEAFSGKAIRISKARFAEIKQGLQELQIRKYPELKHSIVMHGRKSKSVDREQQIILRTGKISRKQEILQILESCFADANSTNQFLELVSKIGLEIYYRKGVATGISDNERHFRFSTLGFQKERFLELDSRLTRKNEMENLRSKGEKNLERFKHGPDHEFRR